MVCKTGFSPASMTRTVIAVTGGAFVGTQTTQEETAWYFNYDYHLLATHELLFKLDAAIPAAACMLAKT